MISRRARSRSSPSGAGEISFPIVRDMDTFCYERQHGADMEVGSYAHRAILHDPEDIPSIEQAQAVADRDAVHRPTTSTRSWSRRSS